MEELKKKLENMFIKLALQKKEGDLVDQCLNLGRRQQIIETLNIINGKDKDTKQAKG